ncbi:hypothetical protein [Halobacteriovorax sp.]|uniref:hypothetical protein n=1 Tax=Halobacteriovorax sp. TaxID=2020862 RepID=UPI003AF2D4AC
MKRILAATFIFILTSNPAYGAQGEQEKKEMKDKQSKSQKSKVDKKKTSDRDPASISGKEVSLTEKHYLIYK